MIGIIQFSRQTCPPCQSLKTILTKFVEKKEKTEYKYVDIDTDSLKTYASVFNKVRHLRALPIVAVVDENANVIYSDSPNQSQSIINLIMKLNELDISDEVEIINE